MDLVFVRVGDGSGEDVAAVEPSPEGDEGDGGEEEEED